MEDAQLLSIPQSPLKKRDAAGVNTVILGAGIAATIVTAPAVATAAGVAGVAYGVGYLFYGKEMDQYINDNFGYR